MNRSRLIKALVLLGQAALVALIFVFIWGSLQKAWEQLTTSQFTLRLSPFWLGTSAIVYAVCLVFPATYWCCVLRYLGQRPTLYRSIRAHLVGHVGKYVPGKVCVVLIRAGLLRGKTVDTTVCVLSIFLEGLMQMAVGALLVVGVLFWRAVDTGQEHFLLYILLLFLGVAVPILPPVFKRIVYFIGLRKFSTEVDKVNALPWRTFLFGIPLMLVFWALISLSYWCVIHAIGIPIPFSDYPTCILAITASMVAGFVFVVAPAGMGVREAIICMLAFSLFKPFSDTPEAAALISTVVLRLLWIVTEMVLAACVYWIPGREKDAPPEILTPVPHNNTTLP